MATSSRSAGLLVALIIQGGLCAFSAAALADDRAAENAERIKQMSPDQKDDLRRKKQRFDELSDDEKQRLRDLHAAIVSDPSATELSHTVTRYTRWLSSLEASERSILLDIKDPEQRIARIKELMQQQEERRFRQYFSNLPEDDRKTIYKWLSEFIAAHADEIVQRLPPHVKQRIADAEGDEARRRELFGSWLRWRREFNLPYFKSEDYLDLFKKFSPETQKTIESSAVNALSSEPEDQRTSERQLALQQQRVEELARTALYSRFFPQISQQELLKYYDAMKPDDLRRKQLEGKEGEELRRELQRMYNWEHGGRGGPPNQSGGRGFGPPSGGPSFGPPPGGRGEGMKTKILIRPPGENRPGDRGEKPPP
jgi:hypothetical protein